jgi:predicted DNA-binding mobile mystery protein A
MKSDSRERARKHLDDRLSHLKPEDQFAAPPKGWIRAIRDALGMSGVQLAARLGVRPQTVDALEKSEAGGTIQLKTLQRAAEALDCTLVYALVPRTSLKDMVQSRARSLALRDLDRVGHTMKLEAQEVAAANQEMRIEDYIRNVLRDRDLWNEP